MRRLVAASAAVALVLLAAPGAAAVERVDRVVLFSLPAVTWDMVVTADMPVLDDLVERGAVAALSTRTAARRPNVERGYLTLGAGNRAFVGGDEPASHLAFQEDARFEGGTAGQALRRRMGQTRGGELVHLAMPMLVGEQDERLFGAEVGALGEALAEAGIRRAVVSAGDLAVQPAPEEQRRSSVLGLVDATGTVDDGRLEGLLAPDPDSPFGVRTDGEAFLSAFRDALRSSSVVLADPGETLRADEFTPEATRDQARTARLRALERSDAILGDVAEALGPRDLLLVLAPAPPTWLADPHLTPIVATGPGIERGWLRSPTTQGDGMVTTADVAPTVLEAFGIEQPAAMTGTPMRAVPSAADGRVAELVDLNEASNFREDFATSVFYALGAGLFSLVAVLAFVVFLGVSRRPLPWLVAVAYLTLAVPSAAHIFRALEVHDLGVATAHLILWGLAASLAALAWAIPGPRWSGAVALLLAAAAGFTVDALFGGPLELNGVFGHSPVVAGRFYGLSNPGHAILYPAALIGLAGLIELRGARRAPRWLWPVLLGLVLVVGLPQFGANFGGLVAGLPAMAVGYAMARGHRIRWRWVLGVGAAAAAAGTVLTLIDLRRPAPERTHLGRFAGQVGSGGAEAFLTVIQRKADAAIGTLALTQWVYVIPVAVAVLALLLWRPKGVLRDVIPRHPVIRAGLAGSLVAAVVGFAVNDSGIAIPALVLAMAVPFLVLMGAETIEPRRGRKPRKLARAG